MSHFFSKKRRIITGLFSAALFSASSLFALAAHADTFPSRTITWVVPFPPGGAMDAIARVLSEEMSQDLGQAIVVENRPGAGGNIGAAHVAKTKPDGHTIMIAANGMAVNPSIYENMSFDPIADFEPISLVAAVPNILVTQADRDDVDSLSDVIQQVQDNPGHYTYASAGIGTSIHLAGALFTYLTDLDMLHIPYRGSGPAVADLLSGQVDYMFDSITSAKPHIEANKLKALAITTTERSSTLPDLPTMAESGVADYELIPWFATFAPAGTPQETINTLNQSMLKAMESDKVTEIFQGIGAEKIGSSPEELKAYLAEETEKWATIIEETGISSE